MPFNVSTEGAYAVLYSVLGIFTILAIISGGYGASFLPPTVRNLLVAQKTPTEGGESITVAGSGGGALATDFFL